MYIYIYIYIYITCYYFNDVIKIEDFDFYNILIEEKSNEDVLAYNTFEYGKYLAIFHKIGYLIGVKSVIISTIFHNLEKIKVDSYGSLPIIKLT